VRKDDHVADRHHRQTSELTGQNGLGLVCHGSLHKTCRPLPRTQPADNASRDCNANAPILPHTLW
jgi:hypothetical protein